MTASEAEPLPGDIFEESQSLTIQDLSRICAVEEQHIVEFVHEGGGQVRLFRVAAKTCRKSRGEKLVEHMRGKATRTLTTEQIMALTRGD